MEQSNTNKVLKGISSQTIVTIGLGIVEIFYFSIMSRLITREDFGFYAAISAITIIFSSISDAGIGSALVQRREMSDDYRNTAYTLSVIIGCFVSLLMVVSSGFFSYLIVGEELKYPLMFMASTLFFNGILSVYYSWLYRQLHFLKVGFISLLANVLSSIIAVVIAVCGYGFYAILFRAVASSLIALVIAFFIVDTSFHLCLRKEYIKSIVNFGGWLTASVIVHNISSQIDRLMMSRLLSVEALGAYNRPKEFIIQIGSRINGIFDTTLFPILSSIQDQTNSLKRAFNRSQYIMNICSMGLALAFICNSELIIRIFFGSEWLDLNSLFQLISISLIFNINGRLGDCYLRSIGLVRQQFNLRSFELVLDVVCILIGSRYGVIGVACGFLLANIILITTKTLYIARILNITYMEICSNTLGGWAYALYFIPLLFFKYLIIPSTLFGNFMSLIVFFIIFLLLFLVFPSLIGRQYKEDIYVIIRNAVFKWYSNSTNKVDG